MTKQQTLIVVGAAAAVLAFAYLATRREVNATVTGLVPTLTYRSFEGAAGAPTATEDSHAKMIRMIEQSERALAEHDAEARN